MATPRTQLAVVRIDFVSYLLPQAKALKLVEIMGEAVEVDEDYAYEGSVFTAKGPANVRLSIVRPEQVVMPQGTTSPAPSPRKRTSTRLIK